MAVIGQVLVQFVFRLCFGMALAMGLTSARQVTSGFFRVHLWVIMGLNTFAALALYSANSAHSASDMASGQRLLGPGIAAALAGLSYIGASIWLYERPRLGKGVLALVTAGSLAAALRALDPAGSVLAATVAYADVVTSGMLLGSMMIAMLLGHWYLNTPTMQLRPLQLLIAGTTAAVLLRAVVAGAGLTGEVLAGGSGGATFWIFVVFRWLAGIVGPLMMARLAARTLEVPNTQSATGILYAGVILVFLGELVSQLLSVDAQFPL